MSTASISFPALHVELGRYQILREHLLEELPDLDDETLHDTLEGITDLKQMLAEVVRSALDDEALASGLSTRLSDMKARLERLEERAKRKRQLVLRAMTDARSPSSPKPTSRRPCERARRHWMSRRRQDPGGLLEAATAQTRQTRHPLRSQGRG